MVLQSVSTAKKTQVPSSLYDNRQCGTPVRVLSPDYDPSIALAHEKGKTEVRQGNRKRQAKKT